MKIFLKNQEGKILSFLFYFDPLKFTPMLLFYLSTALAIFALFFGAGNVVFPLVLGRFAGEGSFPAIAGLLLTGIGGPLIGLCGGVLFQGDFKAFFFRSGKPIGYALIITSALLLGPLAVMPRCLVVAYTALSPYLFGLSLPLFSLILCSLIYLLLVRRSRLLPVLGAFLSPLLILLLLLIILFGALAPSHTLPSPLSSIDLFQKGLITGYDTMDLIASIFFSMTIWHLLQGRFGENHAEGKKITYKTTLVSGLIGGLLLALVYVGLGETAARHGMLLGEVKPEALLITLSHHFLPEPLRMGAHLAVALACITTVMGLAVTFSEIARKDFFGGKVGHRPALAGILALTALFSNLGFERIMGIIHPVVALCYPAIITLTVCNICYKIYGWQPVKIPVLATLIATVIYLPM